MRVPRAQVVGMLCAALVVTAPRAPAAAQSRPATDVPRVELSRDTVELGETFELRVSLDLPTGRTAYFPDTLPSSAAVESLRPVEWQVERVDGGARELTLVYPLIGFRVGAVTLPDIVILSGPAGPDDREVGAWDDVLADPDLAASLGTHTVPGPAVWIASVLELENAAEALVPRPPDDVIGVSWSRGILLAALAFGSVLAWVLVTTGREWLLARRGQRRAGPAVDPIEEARTAALAALDELRGLGLVEAGRVEELYGRSSAALRGYVEHLDPAWGPSHTSSELMRDLERRANGDAAPELYREMGVAEVVKFGRLRPGVAEADGHLSALRAWIARTAPRLER